MSESLVASKVSSKKKKKKKKKEKKPLSPVKFYVRVSMAAWLALRGLLIKIDETYV